jgi:uncharacterized protein YbbC (DUF1343 family)
MPKSVFSLLFLIFSLTGSAQVIPGAGQTGLYLGLLRNKQVGVVANNASVINGRNVVDTLLAMGISVRKVFSPEHGFRGDAGAGEEVKNCIDSITGLMVISLYGQKSGPEETDLDGIDVMVFDLQDVGVRFYTYISTLTQVLNACAEHNIPVILFDRPNPNGFYIDGPVLERSDSSYVGMHPVPVVYGMTIGEFARMITAEGWYRNARRMELTVIPVAGYTHSTFYEIPVKPSPNLPDMNAVWLYPSLCLFEGTVISVGRGTCFPFEVFGHPDLKGFSFSFVPEQIPGMSMNPPYLGKNCRGLDLRGFYQSRPRLKGRISLSWLMMSYADLGNNPEFFNSYFDKLAGNRTLRLQIIDGKSEQEIRSSWRPGIEEFMKIRAKYLLYPE